MLSLPERAEVDKLFDLVCDRVCDIGAAARVALPQPLLPETRPHSHIYHINLSGKSLRGYFRVKGCVLCERTEGVPSSENWSTPGKSQGR